MLKATVLIIMFGFQPPSDYPNQSDQRNPLPFIETINFNSQASCEKALVSIRQKLKPMHQTKYIEMWCQPND